MKKLIILGAGKGSRLEEYTLGFLHKSLLSTGNSTIIESILDIYSKKVNKVLIILSSQHKYLEKYLNSVYQNENIEKIEYFYCDDQSGSFSPLYKALKIYPEFRNQVYINWCDLVPEEIIECDTNTAFTSNDINCRYAYSKKDSSFVLSSSGNIVGSFYFESLNLNNNNYENTSKTEEYDFLDNLNDTGLSKNINISPIKILDYGDVKKYKNQLQHRTLKRCRWFNNITVKKDIVVKSSNCEYGNEVMKNEINWYLGINNILGKEIKEVPKIIEYDTSSKLFSFSMERLSGTTVFEYLNNDKNKDHFHHNNILKNILESLDNLHKQVNKLNSFKFKNLKIDPKDIENEYYKTTLERFKKIKYIIPNLDTIEYVNDEKVFNYANIFQIIENFVDKYKNKVKAAIIHGDPNLSNTMITKDLNIKFIDPRGSFGGKSSILGDPNYDFAKCYYGFSGYDFFNNSIDFKIDKLSKNSILFKTYNIINEEESFKENPEIFFIVGIIWMKLPYYIRNNPLKSIAAFYNGIRIISKVYPLLKI